MKTQLPNPTNPKTLEIFDTIMDINKGRDITEIQAIASDDGVTEYVIVGFIYSKRELIAYINTTTGVGELYTEATDSEAYTELDDVSISQMDLLEHFIGFITVEDLVKYLKDIPDISGYLTLNKSGVLH